MARTRAGKRRAGKRAAGAGHAAQNLGGPLPEAYREMLADAVSSPTQLSEENQPLKRRRIGGRVVTQRADNASANNQNQPLANTNKVHDLTLDPKAQTQTVYDDSEDSTDSDMDWEEVDLAQDRGGNTSGEDEKTGDVVLNIILDKEHTQSQVPTRSKRKPGTAAQKKLWLEVHKLHIMCLLAHVHIRNHWCNDVNVHKDLRKILTKRTVSYLNPDQAASQFQKSRSFTDGLDQAMNAFREKFRITARGMSRSYWLESSLNVAQVSLPEDLDLPMQKSDFRSAAIKLEASRDVGAQLFCAMLRSAGVDVRLVCSLQPLPLTPATKGACPPLWKSAISTSDVDSRNTTDADDSGLDARSATSAISGSATRSSTVVKSSLSQRPRHEQQNSTKGSSVNASLPAKKPKRKRIIESPYPVYWVEAFNDAVQKWIPVDPLVTRSVAKVSRFEPPASDQENNMSYVIAFEDDGSARDVTRRYAKAYNAKTRRVRVESIPGGERWLRKLMRVYKSPHELDRNQVEDAEFAAKEAAEPMPKNVQDFKNHPYYALERHLKRNEVIYPKRDMGKVTAGKSGGSHSLEPIYRRKDVLVVRSADKWYRLGRVVKPGKQPMKRVKTRRRRNASIGDDDEQASGDEVNAGTGLYAFHQTIIYEAPPVVDGRVPRNAYGNLDIYTPSMVPNGAIYITHPDAARAARALSIDYADAVTGFEFKGRHGTAVTRGAVVAVEYREAMQETLKAFQDERTEAEETGKSVEALRMWKRFLIGLKIHERIEGYEIAGTIDEEEDGVRREEDEELESEGGGFLPDRTGDDLVNPASGRTKGLQRTDCQEDGRGYSDSYSDFEDELLGEDEGGGFLPDSAADLTEPGNGRNKWLRQSDIVAGGGGFVTPSEEQKQDTEVTYEANTSTKHVEHNEDVNPNLQDEMNDDEEALRSIENAGPKTSISGSEESNQPTVTSSISGMEKGAAVEYYTVTGQEHARSSEVLSQQLHNIKPYLNLPEEEIAEAEMLQQIYEICTASPIATSRETSLTQAQEAANVHNLRPTIPNNEAAPTITIQSTNNGEMLVERQASNAISAPLHQDSDNDGELRRLSREDTDRGSLLSHDPSDEEADPEWLS